MEVELNRPRFDSLRHSVYTIYQQEHGQEVPTWPSHRAADMRSDVYAVRKAETRVPTQLSSYRHDVYATMDRPTPSKNTKPAQAPLESYKADVYTAHPEMFSNEARDMTKQSSTYRNDVYATMDPRAQPKPKSSGVDSYKTDVYSVQPQYVADRTATDSHTSAVYATSSLHNMNATPAQVNPYKASVYAVNQGPLAEKTATDPHTSAVYATAHLGEMNTTPAAVNSYKATVYAANPDHFAEKTATDDYTSDVYAVAHLGDMVTKSSNDAYTKDVYTTANLDAGSITSAPAVKAQPYKAAVYASQPHTADAPFCPERKAVDRARAAVYSTALSDYVFMVPLSTGMNTFRTSVYHTAMDEMKEATKEAIADELHDDVIEFDEIRALSGFKSPKPISAGKMGRSHAPSVASAKSLNLSIDNLAAVASGKPISVAGGMVRSTSTNSLTSLNTTAAREMERSALEAAAVESRPQRIGHLGMLSNLQKFAY